MARDRPVVPATRRALARERARVRQRHGVAHGLARSDRKAGQVAQEHLLPARRKAAMTTKPRTYNADLAHLPSALGPLTEEQRRIVWPWEPGPTKSGKEKWTKPPRQARDPRRNARSNDPSTWGSYADAVAAVAVGNADGIGYMLKDSNIGAIDLDHCVDQESAKLDS